MIFAVVAGVAGAAVLGAAGVGLAHRIRRLGASRGILAPLGLPLGAILLFGGFFAVLFWLSGFEIACAFTLALMGGAAALLLPGMGLDEFLDRVSPGPWACVRQELYRQFSTAIPWFVLFLFTVLSGVFFWGNLEFSREITLRYVWQTVASLGSLLFPLLTMGLFARERSEGTIEVLMTAPITPFAVTLSKFLATLAFYIVMLAPTLLYYAVLMDFGRGIGKPDAGPAMTSYLGLVLSGAFYIALGLFCSALTSSQILAALLTWVFLIFFLIAGQLPGVLGLEGTDLGDVLAYLQPQEVHLIPFLKGVVDPKNVIFLLSSTAFFLFLATRAIESRKGRS